MKKILNAILTFILVSLICILLISVNLKTILVDGIIKEVIKTQVMNTGYQAPSYEANQITNDPRVQEILNSKEIQELIDKYLEMTINGLLDEDDLDEVKIEEDIYNYIKENKQVIEQKTHFVITDDTIDKIREMNEAKQLSKNLILIINEKKQSITKTKKVVLKGYKTFISIEFQLIIVGIILLDLLLIGLINKSIKIVIKELGIATTTSGILTIIMCIVVKYIVTNNSVLKTFHMKNLLISGAVVLVMGMILWDIYKKIEERKNKNDLS